MVPDGTVEFLEVPVEADRDGRLQGQLHGRRDGAAQKDLRRRRVRLLEAGRESGGARRHVSQASISVAGGPDIGTVTGAQAGPKGPALQFE